MTMQKIHFLPNLGKAPLEIDVPAEIENKLRWALQEFISRKVNLSGADLRRVNLIWADLSWVNLSGADLRGADLRGVNLSWADLSGADLRGADLRGVNLILLPNANGYPGWAWRESEGSPLMISYGCHYGERSFSLPDARAYWAGKKSRREIYAALDYAEAVAKIKGWI
jgi:uncharacterized protein YjbI with pentapeptide repeats